MDRYFKILTIICFMWLLCDNGVFLLDLDLIQSQNSFHMMTMEITNLNNSVCHTNAN